MTIINKIILAIQKQNIYLSKIQKGLEKVSDESEDVKWLINSLGFSISLTEKYIGDLEKRSPKISEDLLNNWAKKVKESDECLLFNFNNKALTLKLSFKNRILDQEQQKWMAAQWMDLANRWFARCMKPKVKKGLISDFKFFFSKGNNRNEKMPNDTNSNWSHTYENDYLSFEMNWIGGKTDMGIKDLVKEIESLEKAAKKKSKRNNKKIKKTS
ncbi:hypothetical protein QYM36_018607 [Artemia franciscana]|uniref:Uncharacterized protein n=1 Tax=Artemia franciscana TaxID=6661 RepID=A0AA88HCI4_ARTSF|nr:hypothetical protein QYM36_018607 [Artemia franciscana]